MTDDPAASDRDAVLSAFIEACPRPTVEQVLEWRGRHPKFGREILAMATDLAEMAALGLGPDEADEPSEAELAAAERTSLARIRAIEMPRQSSRSLHDLILDAGTDIPALARQMGIDRNVVAELEAGRVILPAGGRIVKAMSSALKSATATVEDALAISFWSPQVGMAKSSGTPAIRRRSYDDVVRASGMTEDRIAFWLADE